MVTNKFDTMIHQLERKRLLLLSEIARLEARDFPSEAPKRLCGVMRHICDTIRQHIPGAERTEKERIGMLREFDRLVKTMASHLRYVERSSVRNTPWSIIQCLQDFFVTTADVDSLFIVRPKWDYNYSLSDNLSKVYRDSVSGQVNNEKQKQSLAQALPRRIHIVSFPRLERLNVTLHALLGHEMGHPISQEWVDDHWREHQDKLNKREPSDRIEAWKILQHCLKEIIADLVGVHLFGATALFASFEWAMTRNIDRLPVTTDDKYYPPWRFRIRHMAASVAEDLDLIEQMNLDDPEPQGNIRSWIASIREVAKCRDDWTAMNRWPNIRTAHETIEDAIPGIRQWLQNERLGRRGLKYSFGENSEQIPELVGMLRDGLPPAETGKGADRQRADFRTILHAAWFHKLSRAAEPSFDPSDQKVADLLTLKAIECSHTQELFERRQKAEAAK